MVSVKKIVASALVGVLMFSAVGCNMVEKTQAAITINIFFIQHTPFYCFNIFLLLIVNIIVVQLAATTSLTGSAKSNPHTPIFAIFGSISASGNRSIIFLRHARNIDIFASPNAKNVC